MRAGAPALHSILQAPAAQDKASVDKCPTLIMCTCASGLCHADLTLTMLGTIAAIITPCRDYHEGHEGPALFSPTDVAHTALLQHVEPMWSPSHHHTHHHSSLTSTEPPHLQLRRQHDVGEVSPHLLRRFLGRLAARPCKPSPPARLPHLHAACGAGAVSHGGRGGSWSRGGWRRLERQSRRTI